MKTLNPKKFNLENQYQTFLRRIGLSEEQMHPQQKCQLKHTFYGAWGQLLDCMQEDVSELPEMDAIAVLEHMDRQVKDYFVAEADRYKAANQ